MEETMNKEFGPKGLIKIRAAAELLGVSERWLWFRVKEGVLPVVRLGGTTRIALSDLEAFVETGRKAQGKCGAGK